MGNIIKKSTGTIQQAIADLPDRETHTREFSIGLRDLFRAGWKQSDLGEAIGLSRWRVGQLVKSVYDEPTYLHDPVLPVNPNCYHGRRDPREVREIKELIPPEEKERLLDLWKQSRWIRNDEPIDSPRRIAEDDLTEYLWFIHRKHHIKISVIAEHLSISKSSLRNLFMYRGYKDIPKSQTSMRRQYFAHYRDGDVVELGEKCRRNPGEWILWPVYGDDPAPKENVADDRRDRFPRSPIAMGDDIQLYVDVHHVTYIRYMEGEGRRVMNPSEVTIDRAA